MGQNLGNISIHVCFVEDEPVKEISVRRSCLKRHDGNEQKQEREKG